MFVYLLLVFIILINIIPVLIVHSPASFLTLLSTPDLVRNFLITSGGWGIVLFVVLMGVSIILPIPSTPIALAGGYVYGLFFGTLLALVGLVIGSCTIFFLVRRYGKPLLEKLVDAHHIAHFNHIFARRGPAAALISYIIPIFPSDTVTLLLGLTPISFRTFLFILIGGHIPRYLILNGVGDTFQVGFSMYSVLFLAGGAALLFTVIFRRKLKMLFFKELHAFEKTIRYNHKKKRIV